MPSTLVRWCSSTTTTPSLVDARRRPGPGRAGRSWSAGRSRRAARRPRPSLPSSRGGRARRRRTARAGRPCVSSRTSQRRWAISVNARGDLVVLARAAAPAGAVHDRDPAAERARTRGRTPPPRTRRRGSAAARAARRAASPCRWCGSGTSSSPGTVGHDRAGPGRDDDLVGGDRLAGPGVDACGRRRSGRAPRTAVTLGCPSARQCAAAGGDRVDAAEDPVADLAPAARRRSRVSTPSRPACAGGAAPGRRGRRTSWSGCSRR